MALLRELGASYRELDGDKSSGVSGSVGGKVPKGDIAYFGQRTFKLSAKTAQAAIRYGNRIFV